MRLFQLRGCNSPHSYCSKLPRHTRKRYLLTSARRFKLRNATFPLVKVVREEGLPALANSGADLDSVPYLRQYDWLGLPGFVSWGASSSLHAFESPTPTAFYSPAPQTDLPGLCAPRPTMRRTLRRKPSPRSVARAEEEPAAAAPRRSGKKAVSKPLSQIFQELEEKAARESRQSEEPVAGEEPSSSASVEWDMHAAKRSRPPGLRRDKALPGPSALQEPTASRPLENYVVFHCLGCSAVLGDSVHLCGEETRPLSILVFSRITNNVILDKSLLVGIEGALLGSTYNPLFCQSCGHSVGFRLYSTYAAFSDLKGLFCLFKNSIVCYLLKTKSIVNATEMEFPMKRLNEEISKLKEKILLMDSNLTTIIQDLKTVIHGPLDVELE
ncbi:protein Mis18-beta [Monodelphis domestica]|uniref:protein Mis18-beta n=1 Tax=Monodelphis domestica TaxID=13616 RepID=UPI0024E2441C|nr:protein Mis18-beta [Monodelphis domestica]